MSEQRISLKGGNPDAVFGRDVAAVAAVDAREEGLSSRTLLTESINGLAASLGVDTPQGNSAYEPDAFVAAIQRAHDKLDTIRAQLAEQNEKQHALALELAERERNVTFREKRVAAHEKLAGVKQRRYVPSWLRHRA